MNTSRTIGIIAGISGILLFSSKAVMVKLGYRFDVDSVSLLLLRMIFSLPFYSIIALTKKPQSKINAADYWWIIGLGLIGYYLASYFDFMGLKFIKASLERLILFIYPTLVLIISYLVFGKKISQRQGIGILITYVGIIVIFGNEIQMNQESNVIKGGILVFLSALTYAAYLVGSGWLIPKFGAVVFTAYAMIISCIAVIIHYVLTDTPNLFSFDAEVYLIGFLMAVFATVIPSFLISFAIKRLGANDFSIFGSLGPVSTISLAYLILGEKITFLQFIGAAIILVGIFIAEKKQKS